MSRLHVRHVREALHRDFDRVVDFSDYAAAGDEQREKVFLTRSLAARAVQRFTSLDAASAAETVVDGTDDNGIDAIYLDSVKSRIILVQSKWDSNGTSTIGVGDARNFIAGFKDLTDERFDRFNSKIRDRQEAISAALSDPQIKFNLVVATTGQSVLDERVQRTFDDVLEEMNSALPLVDFDVLGLREFHALVSEGVEGQSIDLDVALENWGTVTDPYEAFYGVVGASVVGSWYEKYGDKLFGENIRGSLGDTDVNSSLRQTLTGDPSHFWYFNNGVTILCQKISRNARKASGRSYRG